MARLSSVLGGILAEFTRARTIADNMTKDLVAEYEKDPILSTFSVPRIALKDLDLTLRFVVTGAGEPSGAAPAVDPAAALKSWTEYADNDRYATLLSEAGFSDFGVKTLGKAIESGGAARHFGDVTQEQMARALNGELAAVVKPALDPTFAAYDDLPQGTRRDVGSMRKLGKGLLARAGILVGDFIEAQKATPSLTGGASSDIDISIVQDDLAKDGAHVQQITLTLTSDDIELVGEREET